MSNQRSHYATTSDGVTIGGTVHGQGPPLVLVQGVMGDGDLDWNRLARHLSARFTCHLPSLRGRGLSGDHPDLGFDRLVDDVAAYVASVGGPTGLVGWSLGADLALAAAGTQAGGVDGVVPVDPVMPGLGDEEQLAALGGAVARMGELAAEGRLTDAARAFAGFPFVDADVAAAEDAGYFEAVGRYVPNMLSFFQQQREYDGPTADDPAVLGAISAPVLVLHGSNTTTTSTRAARHVADHVPGARVQEVPGAGHASPLTHPAALAEAIVEFLAPAQQPA